MPQRNRLATLQAVQPSRLLATRLSRARFLVVGAAFIGAACGGADAPPTSVRRTLVPNRTPEVTLTPPPPPEWELSARRVPQGGYLTVEVIAAQAAKVRAHFAGVDYQLGQRVPGRFWGLVPIDGMEEPGKKRLRVALIDGDGAELEPITETLTITDAGFPTEEVEIPPEKSNLLAPGIYEEEVEMLEAAYSTFTPKKRWEGPFVQPAQGIFTSPYGIRRGYNGAPVSTYHRGLDIAADMGTPISAANNGRVVFAGQLKIRGNAVILDHGYGIFSGYNHMDSFEVELGQDLETGDFIGYMGTTGLSTGSHLHWEVALRGTTIDPSVWLEGEVSPPERD